MPLSIKEQMVVAAVVMMILMVNNAQPIICRSASSSKILKPRAVYSSSGTLSRTSGSSTEALNFDSTKDIRQVVYEVWKVQATERMKQTAKEKKEKEKELEEKKKKVSLAEFHFIAKDCANAPKGFSFRKFKQYGP